jgi:O-antigen/teichoic acid export membrane protein
MKPADEQAIVPSADAKNAPVHPVPPSLGRRAGRGAKVTLLGQVARILVQFGSVVVMSRLLDPADFGLLAMVVAVVGIGEVFRDFGLTQAAIQARTLSNAQQSNLFWINSLIGLALAIIMSGLAWPIAAIYGEPRLVLLTQVIASTFIFNGLSTQYRASLTRDLKFLHLSMVELGGQVGGFALGATMAAAGIGYWSLAGQQIATAGLTLVALIVITRWIPGRFSRAIGTRQFLRFGGFLTGGQLITYASRNVDSLIIGSQFGATALGVYNRAFQLLVVPLSQINAPSTRVALPILSKLQDQEARYTKFILTGQTLLIHPVFMLFTFAIAAAPQVIRIVLGDQWDDVVPLFQVLALAGMFQTASQATFWVFLSRGRMKSQLYWALCSRPLIISAVVLGAQWGPIGVAWGYSLATAAVWPLGILWIAKACAAPARSMFANGLRGFAAYGLCGIFAHLVNRTIMHGSSLWPTLLVSGCAYLAALGVVFTVWKRFRADVLMLRLLLAR